MGNQSHNEENKEIIISGPVPELTILTEAISKLDFSIAKIEQIGTLNQHNPNNHIQEEFKNCETRFQTIRTAIPSLLNLHNQQKTQKLLKNWLGIMIKKVMSVGFAFFQSGKISEKQLKIFCSENILLNIINCCQKNCLPEKYINFINNTLQNRLLPYCLLKYPQSEEDQVNLALDKRVKKTDNFINNEYDFLQKSKVHFQYSETKKYNSEIMKVLNCVINLPKKKTTSKPLSEKEKIISQDQIFKIISQKLLKKSSSYSWNDQKQDKISLFHAFQEDFRNLFEKVKVQEQMKRMVNLNFSKFIKKTGRSMIQPEKIFKEKSKRQKIQKVNEDNEKNKRKYQQKVEGYTKYMISRKLSENLKPFTEDQILEGHLALKNSPLMRVVTKWCLQLRENFKNPKKTAHKQAPFQMKNGTERYLTSAQENTLQILLQRREKSIKQYLKSLMSNNYCHQSKFCFQNLAEQADLSLFSQEESQVGMFATVTRLNYENYLISYLNQLIHNLLLVMKEFEAISFFKKQKNIRDEKIQKWVIQDIEELLQEAFKERNKSQKQQMRSLVPVLITFKIADILRCKCSSRELQIKALYNQIQRISSEEPELFKIVRIKNRLKKGTKDILINLMYRDEILVQVQLAINSNKSNFIDCSNKFNHYIYQLKRSEFGPISQMCSIWMNYDERSDFYLNAFQQYNTERRKKQLKAKESNSDEDSEDQIKQILKKNFQQINMPFCCDYCRYYYTQNCYIGDHRYYPAEKLFLCFPCVLSHFQNYEKIRQSLIPELPPLPEQIQDKQIKPISNISSFPESGMLVKLKSKERLIKYFKISKNNHQSFAIQESRGVIKSLGEVTTEAQIEQFIQNNIIFDFHQNSRINARRMNKNIATNFFIPKFFKQIEETQKTSLKINKNHLVDQSIEKIKKPIVSVRKLNFSNNKLKKIGPIANAFPNLTNLILNHNNFHEVNEVINLARLLELDLSENKIESIPSEIDHLDFLLKCDFSSNLLKFLPDSFSSLKLVDLQLDNNRLSVLPENFDSLQNLSSLSLSKNKLINLPERFGNLNVSYLNLNNNLLTQLPANFGHMHFLIDLILSKNQLKTLPDSFGDLPINSLDLSYNDLFQLPQTFAGLFSLKELNLSSNRLSILPQDFGTLKIQHLNLNANKLEALPTTFGSLISIKYLSIENNNLKKLPNSFVNLPLESLHLQGNELEKLPEEFGNLLKLKFLDLSKNSIIKLPTTFSILQIEELSLIQNQLIELPQDFGNLSQLKKLSLSKNQLTHLPNSFANLKIEDLYLNENLLSALPDNFGDLLCLRVVDLSYNLLTKLPQSFSCLNVEDVFLRKNKLEYLPSEMNKMSKLSKLDLAQNNFLIIAPELLTIPNLKFLYLEKNAIKSVPPQIQSLFGLQYLTLEENPLIEISEQILKLSKLQTITVNENELNRESQEIYQAIEKNIRNIEQMMNN